MSRLVDDEVRARAAAGAGAGDDALMAVLCGVFQGRPPAIGRRQRRSRWSRDQLTLIPPALVAGALTDALVRRLRPSVGRPVALRVLAFAVPVAYFGLFFGALGLSRGMWWSVSLWSGTVALAGATGWLLSWLVVPPPMPVSAACDAAREFHGAERHRA